MKSNSILWIIGFASCLMLSTNCKDDDSKSCKERIGLEKSDVGFGAKADSVIVKINSDDPWWFCDRTTIIVKDTIFTPMTETSKSIVDEWFTVDGSVKYEIKVNVAENESENERVLILGIQAGNCFDGIIVKQAGVKKVN